MKLCPFFSNSILKIAPLAAVTVSLLLITLFVQAQEESGRQSHNELLARYEQIEDQLEEIDEFIDVSQREGAALNSLFRAFAKVAELEAELESLRRELAALSDGTRTIPEETEILISRQDYDGEVVAETDTVQLGEILAFQADIKHLGSAADPLLENFVWQLYGPNGQPVAEVSKRGQLSSQGESVPANCGEEVTLANCFRIRLENLSNGIYTVGLTHQNALAAKESVTSVGRFRLEQQFALTRLVVDTNTEGLRHREVLYSDEIPHLFAYYEAMDGIEELSIDLEIRQERDNSIVHQESLVRQIQTDQQEQRIGLRLDPELLTSNQTYLFSARIYAEENSSISRTEEFSVSDYAIVTDLPETLRSGELTEFSLRLPATFSAPYSVTLDSGNGLSLAHEANALRAAVTGISEVASTSSLSGMVVDSDGRIGRFTQSLNIAPFQRVAESAEATNNPPAAGSGEFWNYAYRSDATRCLEELYQYGSYAQGTAEVFDDAFAFAAIIYIEKTRERYEVFDLSLVQIMQADTVRTYPNWNATVRGSSEDRYQSFNAYYLTQSASELERFGEFLCENPDWALRDHGLADNNPAIIWPETPGTEDGLLPWSQIPYKPIPGAGW